MRKEGDSLIEIIHISDLHFKLIPFANRKAEGLLEGISKFCSEGRHNPYLLVTGDFTQHGDAGEYDIAAKSLALFAERVFITPGNHDYGSFLGMLYSKPKAQYFDNRFAEALGFQHAFFEKRVFVRELQDQSDNSTLMLIGLNSCSKIGLHDFAQGEIEDGQMEALKHILDNCDSQTPKLLFLYHIPYKHACGNFVMSLRDWEKLMKVIRGRVNALAFGHQGLFMRIDYLEKFRKSGKQIRPMRLRSFDMDSDRVNHIEERRMNSSRKDKRHITVLDANNSAGEGCFYYITGKDKQLHCEIRSIKPQESWSEPF